MAEEDPRERQERELEKLDEQDAQEDDRDTEYDPEVRPGGDSTPQRRPQAD
jgi:hypothetical protein